jgi:hypothetical protein
MIVQIFCLKVLIAAIVASGVTAIPSSINVIKLYVQIFSIL